MRGFFSRISQIIGQFGQMGQIDCGVFGLFLVELSAQNLSLCVPSPLFLQKIMILIHFKVISIMNLGCKELGI